MRDDEVALGDRVKFGRWKDGHSHAVYGVVVRVVHHGTYASADVWTDGTSTAPPGITHIAVSALERDPFGLRLDGTDFQEAGRMLGEWCAATVESGTTLKPDIAAWWKKAGRALTSEGLVNAIKSLAEDHGNMAKIAALGGEPGLALQEHAADLESAIASLRAKMCVLYAEEIAAAESAAAAAAAAKTAAAKPEMADVAKMF